MMNNLSNPSPHFRLLRLVLVSLALVMLFAPAVSACYVCHLFSYPDWPFTAWSCVSAFGPGETGCVYNNTWCNTYGLPCFGTGGGCFLAGTMISTPDGDRAIESLQVGDAVWCVGDDGKMVAGRIAQTHKNVNDGYYVLNGETLVTGDHRFMSTREETGYRLASTGNATNYEKHLLGEWKPLADLSLGTRLQRIDGSTETVETIEFVDKGVRVYNFEITPHHNYFANGILVHNRKPTPQQHY